jgi:hypothetical protein
VTLHCAPGPLECAVPAGSAIAARLPGAYFHDAWSVPAADPTLPAMGQLLRAVAATPAWVNGLMALRNHSVGLVGLKNLGGLGEVDPAKAAADYRPGDRVGIFTVIANEAREVLVGDRDKHLDVIVSVHLQSGDAGRPTAITVSTVVHVHRLLGRLYMLPVVPAHRAIVPAVLKVLAQPPAR